MTNDWMRSAISSEHGRDQFQPFRPRRHDFEREAGRRPERVVDDLDDGVRGKRLAQVSEGLPAHRLEHRFRRVVGGHHDDERRRGERPRLRQDVEPAHARQADVQQDDVEGALPQEGEGLGAVSRGLHVMAGVFQQCGQSQTQPPVVVDDQDAAARCGLRIHRSIL